MSDPVSNVEIEDVLSSIRRLVSTEHRAAERHQDDAEKPEKAESEAGNKLVLTPSLRVDHSTDEAEPASQEEAEMPSGDMPDSLSLDAWQVQNPEHEKDTAADATGDDAEWGDATDLEAAQEATEIEQESETDAETEAHATFDDGDDQGDSDWFDDGDATDDAPDGWDEIDGTEAKNVTASAPETSEDQDWFESFADNAEDTADSWPDATGDAENDTADAEDEPAKTAQTATEWTEPEPVEDDQTPLGSHDAEESVTSGLEARIAEVEAAVAAREDQWEPDGPGDDAYAGGPVSPLPWVDHAAEDAADEPEPVQEPQQKAEQAAPEVETVVAATAEETVTPERDRAPETTARPATEDWLSDDAILDEEALRDLVSDIVRQELQGALGERITRNVRKLVRREIHRALMSQDFD